MESKPMVTKNLETITRHYPLTAEDRLRLQMLEVSGGRMITCGVVTWGINRRGDSTRVTQQLALYGLDLIPDRSTPYEDLMNFLDEFEANLPDDPKSAFYYIWANGEDLNHSVFYTC